MPETPTATNNSRYNFSPFARIIQTFFILSFSGRVDPRRSLRRIYHPRPRRRLFPSTLASLSGVIKFLRYRARPNCTEWNPKQSANAISSKKNNASSRPRNSLVRFLFLKDLSSRTVFRSLNCKKRTYVENAIMSTWLLPVRIITIVSRRNMM